MKLSLPLFLATSLAFLEQSAAENENGRRTQNTVQILLKVKNNNGRGAVKKATMRNNCPSVREGLGVMCISANENAVQGLRNNPDVEYVEADEEVHALGSPDELLGLFEGRHLQETTPWGITEVQADGVSIGSTPRTTCVVDTGYALGHPDLPTDVTGFASMNGDWNNDGHGHGSHCAGTVAASGGNGQGVIGVASGTSTNFRLAIGKGLGDNGSGSTSGVIEAVSKCVDEGNADVVSMSLGGGGYSQAFVDVLQDAYENKNTIIVAAAGNSGDASAHYPSGYDQCISVGATDINGNIASFSTHNPSTEISGPGVGVNSTVSNDGYASWSGTSMATPHVAGVLAKVWTHFPNCSNKQMRYALGMSAKSGSGQTQCDCYFGKGIVQAEDLYNYIFDQGGCDNIPEGSGAGGCSFFGEQDFCPGGQGGSQCREGGEECMKRNCETWRGCGGVSGNGCCCCTGTCGGRGGRLGTCV